MTPYFLLYDLEVPQYMFAVEEESQTSPSATKRIEVKVKMYTRNCRANARESEKTSCSARCATRRTDHRCAASPATSLGACNRGATRLYRPTPSGTAPSATMQKTYRTRFFNWRFSKASKNTCHGALLATRRDLLGSD